MFAKVSSTAFVAASLIEAPNTIFVAFVVNSSRSVSSTTSTHGSPAPAVRPARFVVVQAAAVEPEPQLKSFAPEK